MVGSEPIMFINSVEQIPDNCGECFFCIQPERCIFDEPRHFVMELECGFDENIPCGVGGRPSGCPLTKVKGKLAERGGNTGKDGFLVNPSAYALHRLCKNEKTEYL